LLVCERNHLQIADVVAERDIFIQVAAADALALTGQTLFVRIRGLDMGVGGTMVQMPARCRIIIRIDTPMRSLSPDRRSSSGSGASTWRWVE